MIFLDTSGIFALADQDDEKHVEALTMLDKAQANGELLLIHSYVIVEAAALLLRNLPFRD